MPTVYTRIRDAIGSLVDSGAHINVAEAARKIVKELGLSERFVNYTHVEIRNMLNEPKFKRVPFSERILFLPHCLKKPEGCGGKYGEEGFECVKKECCGECQLNQLRESALKAGYSRVFIVPGGSMVVKLAEKYKPKAVLGVACNMEVNLGFGKMSEFKIPAQGVLLLKEGCRDTEANLEEVKEKMMLYEE